MKTTLWVLGVAVVAALARGGRPQGTLSLWAPWLVPVVLGLQLALYRFPVSAVTPLVMMGSYALLIYWVFRNRRHPFLQVLLAGILLNATVMALNGGRMPVSLPAARSVGTGVADIVRGDDPRHAPATADSTLAFLGDVIPVPWPVPTVISIGDILICAGLFLGVQALMGKPLTVPTRLPSRQTGARASRG